MKRTMTLFASVLFAIVAVSAAHAAEVTHYKSKGSGASAGFNGVDGCVYSSTYIAAASDPNSLFVSIQQYDWCTSTILHDIYGAVSLGPNEFIGTKRLDNASLLADIIAYDYVTASPVPLSIDMDWEGEGDIFRGMFQNQSRSGAYFFFQRGSGSSRSAVPSGTISDGVTNYATGYSWGQLSYTSSSSMTIAK